MKKIILFIIILLVITAAVVAGVFIFKKPVSAPTGTEGIQITLPAANAEVSSPLKITGVVTGNGWTGFEGQVGTVRLLDGAGKELASGFLAATTEWTTLPTNFETTLNFVSDKDQSGSLVFHNENPSGLAERNKEFSLPVKIKKTDTMLIKIYFNNSNLDPEYSCNKVFPVERIIPKTEAVASASIRELLKGPTQVEKDAGYFTSINEGVVLQMLTIGMESGMTRVDFNEQLQFQVGGSCRVSAIRAEITETLKQFPTVKSVIISIDGRTEDILQP